MTQLVDALIVCDSRKTLSSLYRQFVDELDPKAAADFFRESPWQVDQIGLPRKRFMLDQFLGFWPILEPDAIVISIDDSLGVKHKVTRHLEAVDFQHNHTESTRKKQVYSNGYVFVETHVQMDDMGFSTTRNSTCVPRWCVGSIASAAKRTAFPIAASIGLPVRYLPNWLRSYRKTVRCT